MNISTKCATVHYIHYVSFFVSCQVKCKIAQCSIWSAASVKCHNWVKMCHKTCIWFFISFLM